MRSIFHFRHIFGVPVSQQELDKILFSLLFALLSNVLGRHLRKTPSVDLSRDVGGITKELKNRGVE